MTLQTAKQSASVDSSEEGSNLTFLMLVNLIGLDKIFLPFQGAYLLKNVSLSLDFTDFKLVYLIMCRSLKQLIQSNPFSGHLPILV